MLPQQLLVESKLLTLKDVAIASSGLAGSGADGSVQTTSAELSLERVLNLGGGSTGGVLLLGRLRLDNLLGLLTGNSLSLAEGLAVMRLVPLAERSGIDLDYGGLGEGICADEFVVGRMEDDTDNTGLARDSLRSPGEVAGVETESTELAVSSTGTDKMDTLSTNTYVVASAFEFFSLSVRSVFFLFEVNVRVLAA